MPFGLETKDLVVFVAGAIVALLVTFFFYKKGKQKKQITYSVQVRSLVYTSPSYPAGLKDGLKITYNGKDVNRLVRVTIYGWNSGNQTIVNSDLNTKIPLALELPKEKFDVLQISVASQTRAANNTRVEGNRLFFDYLNSKDGFVIDVFGDENSSANLTATDVKVVGEIVGVTREVWQSDYELGATRGPSYLFMIIGAVMGLVVIGNLIDLSFILSFIGFNLSPAVDYYVNIVLGTLFGLVGAFFLIGGCLMLFMLERVPAKLLSFEGQSATVIKRLLS